MWPEDRAPRGQLLWARTATLREAHEATGDQHSLTFLSGPRRKARFPLRRRRRPGHSQPWVCRSCSGSRSCACAGPSRVSGKSPAGEGERLLSPLSLGPRRAGPAAGAGKRPWHLPSWLWLCSWAARSLSVTGGARATFRRGCGVQAGSRSLLHGCRRRGRSRRWGAAGSSWRRAGVSLGPAPSGEGLGVAVRSPGGEGGTRGGPALPAGNSREAGHQASPGASSFPLGVPAPPLPPAAPAMGTDRTAGDGRVAEWQGQGGRRAPLLRKQQR